MMLDEVEAGKLLSWPYVQSPWDDVLHQELRTWGYSETEKMKEEADAWCNLDGRNDLSAAFKALGVDTRSAGKGGPDHCFHVAHEGGDAMERDKTGNLPPPWKQQYKVDGITYPVSPRTPHAYLHANLSDYRPLVLLPESASIQTMALSTFSSTETLRRTFDSWIQGLKLFPTCYPNCGPVQTLLGTC
jgi:hypothetical protein